MFIALSLQVFHILSQYVSLTISLYISITASLYVPRTISLSPSRCVANHKYLNTYYLTKRWLVEIIFLRIKI
jgi:hypothetical protein